MKYIEGYDRNQTALFPVTLEESIDPDNEVRLIDLFTDSLDLEQFGFKVEFGENGRPAYHPSDLLKLFIYGYLNRCRSSRQLEKETKRNIEMMWLIKGLSPDHNTIANFRKDNPKAIKKVFRSTVEIAKNFNLIGGKLIAGDSSKFRAQNSKKNNYNPKKIKRHIAYIDKKLEEYTDKLSQQDGDKQACTEQSRSEEKELIRAKIKKHEQRKVEYQQLQKQLDESGDTQISTSDPESRQIIIRSMQSEVAYNVQTTVDAENNIPIDYKTTNTNDLKAMGNMLARAKTILRTNQFTALYDKGYHTGSEFKTAHNLGVEVMVAIPKTSSSAPDPAFTKKQFIYNPDDDTYTCPAGEILKTNGKRYKKNKGKTFIKHYKTDACMDCKVKSQCTRNPDGRRIYRPEHSGLFEKNRQRIETNKDLYRRRKSIVEHPYGTIKRQWGFSYIMTKRGKERADADVGLAFTAYNLRRIINIIGVAGFREYLKELLSLFFLKYGMFKAIKRILSYYKPKSQTPKVQLAGSLKVIVLLQRLNFTVGF